MEARSQLRHRPTLRWGQSILAYPVGIVKPRGAKDKFTNSRKMRILSAVGL
jgi:hypothetical protein